MNKAPKPATSRYNMTSIVTVTTTESEIALSPSIVTEYNNDFCEVINVNTTDNNNNKKLLQLSTLTSDQSINNREVDTRDDEVGLPPSTEARATTQPVDSFDCCERESIEITRHEVQDNGTTEEDSNEEEQKKEQPTSFSLLQQQGISLKKSVSRSFTKLSKSLSSKASESEEVVQQIIRTSSSGLKNVWQNLSVSKSASVVTQEGEEDMEEEEEDAATMMISAFDGVEVEMNKSDEYADEKKNLPNITVVAGTEDEAAELVACTNTKEEVKEEKLNSVVVPPNKDDQQSSNKPVNNNKVKEDEDFIIEVSDAMTAIANEISSSLRPIVSDNTTKVEEQKPTLRNNLSKASVTIKTSFSSIKKSLVSGFFGNKKDADLHKEEVVKTKDEVITDAVNEAYDIFRQVSNKW